MKKFYFLLVALMVGIAANAAAATSLYLIGEPAGGWSPLKGIEMTQTSSGVFELDVTLDGTKWLGFSQKLGTSGSDWNTMNGSRYGAPRNNYSPSLGEVVNLLYPSENSFQISKGDYHFVVDTNNNTFKMTGQEVEDPTANVLYLRGDVSSWNASDDYKFTANGDTYTLSVAKLSGSFKIANSDYSQQFSAAAPIALNTPTEVSNMGTVNCTLADGTITNAVLTFVKKDKTSGTLTITGTTGGDTPVTPPTTDYTTWYVNVVGPFNNYQANGVQPNAEGVAVDYNVAVGNTGLKIMTWNATAGDVYYITDGSEIALDTWTQMYVDGYDAGESMIADATASSVYDVKYNCATNQIYVSLVGGGSGEDPVTPPVTDEVSYALHGCWTSGDNWGDIKLTNNNGVWESDAFQATGDAVQFGVKYLVNGQQEGWYAASGDATVAVGQAMSCATGGENFTLAAGTYTASFNPTAMTLTISKYEGELVDKFTYALHGSIFVQGDTEWYSRDLTESNGVWSATLSVYPGEFGIKQMNNSVQSKWYNAPEGTTAVDAAGVYETTDFGGTNWVSSLEGNYVFTFDPANNKLTIVAATDGVANVAVEAEGAVEFYNLNGVRVSEPTKGLYIRRQGNTVTKVIL